MSSSISAPPRVSGDRGRDAPLIDGPRWYRIRIRSWGPLLGLLFPALIGGTSYATLYQSDAAWSGAIGLIGGVVAAPGLLIAGAPFGDRSMYPIAVAASAVAWVLVGFLASRRATRHPLATWSDYWRHYFWMAAGIWVGSGIALGVATISLGEALF
ncbi:hypothetical protein [uncultured Ilumatobacter sp.]|uniref:hypothetical protein n=1 Tax=uncultured Ilumatobacter sp. TaxID=879968 RepID=UPI00374FB406